MVGRYFLWPIVISIVLLLGVAIVSHSWELVYLCVVLTFLEVSLSFDNAIVNAKILEMMSPLWQKYFIWIGIPIAVFGMRLLFPVALVYAVTPLSMIGVIDLALHQPQAYAHALEKGYPIISSFGGAFLWMVFFHFLFSTKRHIHWLPWIETSYVVKILSRFPITPTALTLLIGFVFFHYRYSTAIFSAYLAGTFVYLALHLLSGLFLRRAIHKGLPRLGFIGFLYLEILDAAFSFDGVIGAFAISMNVIVMMVGLGIGALFVRSLTLYFVHQKTLTEFIYLEHGAYYAIGFLAAILLLNNFMTIPEWASGSVGIAFILAAFASSILMRTKK